MTQHDVCWTVEVFDKRQLSKHACIATHARLDTHLYRKVNLNGGFLNVSLDIHLVNLCLFKHRMLKFREHFHKTLTIKESGEFPCQPFAKN